MTVRAKFHCSNIVHRPTTSPDDTYIQVHFHAVYGNGEANKDWSKWTPAGNLDMVITNPEAANWFEMGKEYWLDIHPVEASDN